MVLWVERWFGNRKDAEMFSEKQVDTIAKGLMKTKLECMECDHTFSRKIRSAAQEVKCPKCGGYDIELAMNSHGGK